jgi:hypothetical protein
VKIPSGLTGAWLPAAAKLAPLTRLPGISWILIVVTIAAGGLIRVVLEWQLRLTLTEIFRSAPGGSVVVLQKRGLGGAMWVRVGEGPVPAYRPLLQQELP